MSLGVPWEKFPGPVEMTGMWRESRGGVEGRAEVMWESVKMYPADKIVRSVVGRTEVNEQEQIVDGRVAELVGGAEN